MNDILAKISSYDIFNNLVPGAVLAFLLSQLDIYTVDTKNVVVDLIVFYFMGVVVSRIGSLVLEPLLKLVGFVRYAPYSDYITASQKDERLAVLLEVNNQFRTYAAVMLVAVLAYFAKDLVLAYGLTAATVKLILILAVTLLFLSAFRKQTRFIKKRVEYHTKSS